MRESAFKVHPKVQIGTSSVTIVRSGQSSTPVVANILGDETDPVTGRRTIWLDRIAHRGEDSQFEEGERKWVVSGAVSTVMRAVA